MLANSTNHSQTGWGIPVITGQHHVAFTPVWLGPEVRIRICDRLISYITMWMVKGFFSKVSINTVCRYYDAVSAWVQCGCTCLWQQAAADSWEQTVTSTWRDRESGLGVGKCGDIWSRDSVPNISVCGSTAAMCPEAVDCVTCQSRSGMQEFPGGVQT